MEAVKSQALLAIALVLSPALVPARALEEPLASGSFSVRSTVSVIRAARSGAYLETNARLHERYSGAQERARLGYELTRGDATRPKKGLFYLDKSLESAALLFEPESRTCSESSVDELCSLLNLGLEWWSSAARWAPRHVVGPARLMFLVQEHRSLLKPISTSFTFRNVACHSYALSLGSVNLFVHYSELELAMEASKATPLLIQLSMDDWSAEVTFASLEPLEPALEAATGVDWPRLVGTGGQQFQLDTFTFPPLSSCINALAAPQRVRRVFLGPGKGRGPTRLSFDLNLKSQATRAKMVQVNVPAEFELSGSLAYASPLELLSFKAQTGEGQLWQLAHVGTGKLYQLIEPNEHKIGAEAGCVVTRTRQRPAEEPSFGRLLVGADTFVYLGEAYVRGKLVQLIGTTNGSLPYWLEQPGEYMDYSKTKPAKGELKMRPPDMGNARSLLFLDPQTGSPVQLEIVQQFTKHSVEVFNFRWDLDVNRPIGEQFSLAQKCHHLSSVARAELVLEAPGGFQIAGSVSANERNFALLAALQDSLSLEPTTVFDLESKVLNGTKQILLASFKVARQDNRVTDVIYLGQGHANYEALSTLQTSARTFHICAQMAAQLGQNRYFGYNALERKCFIDKLNSASGEDGQQLPDTITLNPREPMEMYRLNATSDEKVNDRWLDESSRARFKKRLLALRLSLFDQKFTISRAEIELGLERPQFSNFNSIKGVGLAPSSKGVRKVAPAPIYKRNLSPNVGKSGGEDEERSLMTFEQCQAACLGSTWCASFSLCLVNYQLECLVASFRFETAQVRQQLADASGKSVKVRLGGRDGSQEVELVRHRNCELHNKNHLDMFGRAKFAPQPSNDGRRFVPVTSREQCAQLCVERNLEVLKQDMESARSLAALLGPNVEETHYLKQLNNVMDNHRANTGRLCQAFHYIGQAKLGDESVEALDQSQRQVEGHCSLGDLQIGNKEAASDTKTGSFVANEIESYPFRAELFFERREGLRLLESQLSFENKRYYRLIGQQRSTTIDTKELNEALTSLRNLVHLGDNFQNRIYAPELNCALYCLLQSLGPWPACRSFDLIQKDNDASILCQLNSITLQQATTNRRQDLIDLNSSQAHQLWHYEPQPGYLLDELNFSATINLYLPEDTQINKWSLGWLSTLCLTVVAKLGGLALGIKMGHRLFKERTDVAGLINRNLDQFRLE